MQTLLLTAALLANAGSFDRAAGFESLPAAAAAIGPTLQTGSLIFSAGDCLAVKAYTASPYTHVAVVAVTEQGERLVYDSTGGVGVRRLPLADYLATQAPVSIDVLHPARPLTAGQSSALAAHLESQLGRPYAIAHHVTGERCAGLHCAEYATDALMAAQLVQARQPPRVSPASLRQGVTTHAIYSDGERIQLSRPEPPPPVGSNACEQLWLDTQTCCRDCCRRLSGWFWCR